MVYILYNPLAGNRTCEEKSKAVGEIFASDEKQYVDVLTIEDYNTYFEGLSSEDRIVICGGDGTINYLINATNLNELSQDIYYFPAGSGNDFYHDIDSEGTNGVYRINDYLKCVPKVYVNSMEKYFINGIGYGLDGYCCEEGDKKRIQSPGEKVNYASIALKGLFYAFKKVNAKVTVDGVTKEYSNVWMVPTMNGRFYGGGMMCAPDQDRLNEEGKVTVVVVHSKLRLLLLIAFLTIFKGTHVKHKSLVTVMTGSDVTVEFDRPTPLQIDGETLSGVTKYSVKKEKSSR